VAAPAAICQALSSEDTISMSQAFDQSIAHARKAFERADIAGAAQHVRRARAQSGYQRAPEAMNAWRQLYLRFPRTKLSSAWEHAVLPAVESPLKDLRLSLSGKYALTLSGSNTIRIWDIAKSECVVTFDQDAASIESVCMTDDARSVLTGGWEIKLWDARRGACLRSLDREVDMVASLDFSPDGAYALSAAGKTIKLWDVSSGLLLRELAGHTAEVTVVRWSADGSYAVSGGADRRVCFWDVAAGTCAGVLEGHTQAITALQLTPDGARAVSGGGSLLGRPGELLVWDLATGTGLHSLVGHSDGITAVHISGDSRFVVSASRGRTIRLWDLRDGHPVHTIEGLAESVEGLRLTPDGAFLVFGTKSGDMRIWALDWQLEERPAAPWDDAALPYLHRFLSLCTPYSGRLPGHRPPKDREVTAALKRSGKPAWTDADLERLFYQLGCAGFGWLDRNGVLAMLAQLAETWRGPHGAPDYTKSSGGLMRRLFGHRPSD
jgi:WD40 repeat protein